ncbi:MAG: carboxypeptidase-like regulatory domain-containing protein, partial [Saprospiraceae bacterium]
MLVITMTSCHKDSEESNEETYTPFTAEVYQEVGASLIGYVYDENNEPVADARVSIYSNTTKTNKWGVFSFKDVKMDKHGTYLKVIKDGYILGSDYIYPIEGAVSYSYVKMAILDGSKTFESNAGGNIAVIGGGQITFNPGTIMDAKGVAYNGKVSVTSRYLHPEDKDLDHKMPGGLIADAANGNTVILGTLGMMSVELRD